MRSFVMQLLYDDLKNIEYIMNWSSLAINEEGLSTEVNYDQVCKRFFLKEIETMHLCHGASHRLFFNLIIVI